MPKELRPSDFAALVFDPVMARAAMKARCASASQPLRRLRRLTGVKARRSPRPEKSPSPQFPTERQRSQMTGMVGVVLIGERGAKEIQIGKGGAVAVAGVDPVTSSRRSLRSVLR